jgi:Flp pilus assembly protein TadD
MSLLKRILGKPTAFGSFSDQQKRQLLEFNAAALRMERMARSQGTSITFSNADSQGQLLKRLSDTELTQLERIRALSDSADATRGAEAIALYQEVSQLAPWDEICLMSIGVEYAQAGQFDLAAQWLEKASRVNPSNPRVRDNLMAVQVAGGQRGY